MNKVRLVWLALLFVLILPMASPPLWAAGTKPNPVIFGTPRYLLFASTVEDTSGLIYLMDGDGNLKSYGQPQTSYDAYTIAVSPDGRTVVYSGYTTQTLTTFFIGDQGVVSSPVYCNFDANHSGHFNPVAFHPNSPFFYVSTDKGTAAFRFNRLTKQVELTGQVLPLDVNPVGAMQYSSWGNCMVYLKHNFSYVGTAPVREDGTLDTTGSTVTLPFMASSDFKISPDGRWAIGANQAGGGLLELAVGRDGSLSLIDRIVFNTAEVNNFKFICFNPDGRRLYLLSEGSRLLTSFNVDQQTGKLSECSYLTRAELGGQFLIPINLVVTPDGRYAVFRAFDEYDYGCNVLHVVRLNEDGTMTYLPDKAVGVAHIVGGLAFAPYPQQNAAEAQWALYE